VDPVVDPDVDPDVDPVVAVVAGTIEDYIRTFPPEVQQVLEQVRGAAHRAAPEAQETISYQIPTLTLRGRNLVHFAGWAHHVSVYPVPAADSVADAAFDEDIAPYRSGRSTAKFPLDGPLPEELVERLVRLLARRAGQGA
jgi:uncharacterized protein YdhG (YjbR/CyaY superfamily)